MRRSPSPSPLTSPALLTALPEQSPAATPFRRKPFVPSRVERPRVGGKSAAPVVAQPPSPSAAKSAGRRRGNQASDFRLSRRPRRASLRRFRHIVFSLLRRSSQGIRTRTSQRPAVSVPRPPSHRSRPGPPFSASRPVWPNSRSRPAPPNSRSRPLPPQRTSLPPWPRSTSFPPCPSMTSLPEVPFRISPLSVPWIVTGKPLQVRRGGGSGPPNTT